MFVIGVAQIYLPYYADRDKLRGLFEEDMSQKARREMELIQKEEQRKSKAYATSIDQQKAKKVWSGHIRKLHRETSIYIYIW